MLTQLAYSLLGLTALAGVLSLFANRKKDEGNLGPISSYLLAGRTLGRTSVVSLLMSSSFSLNALFYAAWIGYSIGAWALLIQGAWSVCYFLLARYTDSIRQSKSIHDFLFTAFGAKTRVVAGILSLFGMMCQIGWEAQISASTFGTLLSGEGGRSVESAMATGALVAAGVVAACLFYTVVGGLRGNAIADQALNLVKLGCLITVIAVVGHSTTATVSNMFPPWAVVSANMGLFGLLTNITFNLVWQFVDASSWQSIIAGKQLKDDDMSTNLKASGLAIFVVPGVIGTILGIVMHGITDVNEDNIIARVAQVAFTTNPFLGIACAVLMIAAVMSLLDGLFLACAFTLVVDVRYPMQKLSKLEQNSTKAEHILSWVRITLVAIAVLSAWGVHALVQGLGLSLFSFVYVLIISQLSLLGPVFVALATHRQPKMPMWWALAVSFVVGILCAWAGKNGWDSRFSDAAGLITAVVSLLLAFALSRSKPKQLSDEAPVH